MLETIKKVGYNLPAFLMNEEENKMETSNKIGIAKFWGWQARAVSMGSMTIVLGYLTIFCTDTLMLPAALVGTLLLVSKIFDGVTDLIAGYIIENTKTRWGKARPYEFFIIALWLVTWALFSCPEGWSTVVKCVWVFVMYTLVNSIFATFLISNQTPYMLRAFDTQEKIVKVNSYGGIVVTIGCAVVSMLFPQLMATMATSSAGWSKLVGIFALPLAVLGILRFLTVKETVQLEDDAEESKVSFSDIFELLKTNKHIYIVVGISFFYNFVLNINAYTYYFKYIGGGIDRYTVLAALSMPLLIVMFIFPVLMQKGITIRQIIMFGACCGAVGWAMNFFAGDNMTILIIAGVLYSFAGLPIAYLSGLLILDCAEYNVLIGKKRMETTIAAVSSVGTKIGAGLGIATLGLMLSVFGYDGASATQTDSTIFGIRLIFSLIPAAVYVIIAILAKIYSLDGVLAKLRAEKA